MTDAAVAVVVHPVRSVVPVSATMPATGVVTVDVSCGATAESTSGVVGRTFSADVAVALGG